MVRITALGTALALAASSAFAGTAEPVVIEPAPVAPVATGSMGNALLIGLGAAALVGGAILLLDDDDSSSTTTPVANNN